SSGSNPGARARRLSSCASVRLTPMVTLLPVGPKGPQPVLDDGAAERQIGLHLPGAAAGAAGLIRAVPCPRLEEHGTRPLDPVRAACRDDVDDPAAAERRRGADPAGLDLDIGD